MLDRKQQAKKVTQALQKMYPDAVCALEHKNPFQLAVATILSAQCTDLRVNIVTKDLFKKYKTPRAFAESDIAELEQDIKSTGFFRNKAKSIKAMSQAVVSEHGGHVPRTLEELIKLPGIGRKTANVILGTGYGIASGVVVDTHVERLSRRLGLTKQKTPEKIEQELMELLPEKEWIQFSHRMIWHGRQICMARKPKCSICGMKSFCPKIGVTDQG